MVAVQEALVAVDDVRVGVERGEDADLVHRRPAQRLLQLRHVRLLERVALAVRDALHHVHLRRGRSDCGAAVVGRGCCGAGLRRGAEPPGEQACAPQPRGAARRLLHPPNNYARSLGACNFKQGPGAASRSRPQLGPGASPRNRWGPRLAVQNGIPWAPQALGTARGPGEQPGPELQNCC